MDKIQTAFGTNRGVLSAWMTTLFIVLIFSDYSYASKNYDSVPFGFRVQSKQSDIKDISPIEKTPVSDQDIRPISPVEKGTVDKVVIKTQEPVVFDGENQITVPNLVGQTRESAIFFIGKSGLMIGTIVENHHDSIAFGKVIEQVPAFGGRADLDSPINMVISSGPPALQKSDSREFVQQAKKGSPGNLLWEDKPLSEILDEVQSASGIQFKVPGSLKDDIITAEIHAADWKSAIKKLLKGYSIVGVSNSDGDLIQVLLMSDNESKKNIVNKIRVEAGNKIRNKSGKNKKSVPGNPAKKKKFKTTVKHSLSKTLYAKLNNIKGWPVDQPLPHTLYSDAELNNFFKSNGIHTEEDLEKSHKIRDLKRAARKELLIIKMRARKNNITLE